MKINLLTAVIFGFFMTFLAGTSEARTLATDVSLSAGKWSYIRLLNTPGNAQIDVKINSDGNISVFLLGHDGNGKPAPVEQALHRIRASGAFAFSVNADDAGTYYLVLDNRTGSEQRLINASVNVLPGKATGKGTLGQAISSLKAKLRQAFVFNELQIDVRACGHANAYSGPTRVLICAEHIERLQKELVETPKVRDALLFTLLHEIGHVMLRQWSYPFYDNEEVADEIATAIMVMFNETAAVRTQAEYFATIPARPEADKKLMIDDRHPLSAQRARNILRWLGDPAFLSKWQTVLVPHMQTTLLETLARTPQPWSSPVKINQELARRGNPGAN